MERASGKYSGASACRDVYKRQVGDDQRNTAAPLGCRKLDFAAGRRICDRVVQQDGHRLPDALAVTIAFWKGIVGKGNMDADLFLRRSWFVPFSGVEQDVYKRQGLR